MRSTLLLFLLLLADSMVGQITDQIIKKLAFRNLGPAFMTGRISDIAKHPKNSSTWYVATASSGVWKTRDNGTSWEPIFDDYGSYSTGCITIDPSNPLTIWLGTGENQSQRSVGWGDGIYKSIDGGHTWKNMGLPSSEHIGKILVHPDHSNEIIVAAQGPLWSDGGDRGIFKSSDGGKNWRQTLKISENTGASEVIVDPKNPQILYASTYQRRRHTGILIAGGEESRIYKSIDGGETWGKISQGLPDEDVGRIALTISPQNSDVLYAMVAATQGKSGFYRSDDAGMHWKKVNDYTIVDPQYYGEIYADPHRFDCVYIMDVMIHVTEDGGKNFRRLNSKFKHVDNHALLFDAQDPAYLMVGCDGGIYESWNRGETWTYHSNLPIMQFYRVGLDNDLPFYNVYGGTQDNSTLMGPSQTNSRHGITNSDWTLILGGDGFQARVDPADANTVYAQSQYAGLVRYDRISGQRTELQPQPGLNDEPIRWHWDAPLLISHFDPKRLYYAAQHLYQSDDRGDHWRRISDDLSRGEDRNQREVMGKLWPPEAVWKNVFTSPYGTIVSLSESKIKEGLLVIGTDDGLIQVSSDHGATWSKTDVIKGIPERAYVADVFASQHHPEVIYAVFNNHKEGDFKPYVVRSRDAGKSWSVITENIDAPHACWSIYEDFEDSNLLFLGTEFGVWCSINAGTSWIQMDGGLPPIPVRDLEIQERESDLVLATFGRGFYILDNYSILRKIAKQGEPDAGILAIHSDGQYFLKGNLGYSEKGVFGDNFYNAPNPEPGTRFEIFLKEKIPTKKEQRIKNRYPTYDELKSEDLNAPPSLFIQISDTSGAALCQLDLKNKSGYQTFSKELRTRHTNADGSIVRLGPRLQPGKYTAQLRSLHGGELEMIGEPAELRIMYRQLSTEKPDSGYFTFYQEATNLLVKAETLAQKLKDHVATSENKLAQAQLDANAQEITRIENQRIQLIEMQYDLSGDQTKIKRFQYHLPGLIPRIRRLYNNQFSSWQITGTHRGSLKMAQSEIQRLSNLLEGTSGNSERGSK